MNIIYDIKDPDYDFNFKDKSEFAYCEDKLKEYMGEENYKKVRPYMGMSTYYVCKGKKYPVVFYTRFMYVAKCFVFFIINKIFSFYTKHNIIFNYFSINRIG
ncbi:hypothetical protein [Campylobacter taeniopygiae]|uniref:hypothetical protein n=1 Tax=Campylobacter taeniopygiae TaxID=2510188 RepID=UPI003D6BB09B